MEMRRHKKPYKRSFNLFRVAEYHSSRITTVSVRICQCFFCCPRAEYLFTRAKREKVNKQNRAASFEFFSTPFNRIKVANFFLHLTHEKFIVFIRSYYSYKTHRLRD